MSVKNNIQYGKPHATEEDIVKAAKLANAHEFITKLPKGYETVVGERGAKLSGGQRQRIAIARTILKDPAIVILDEATSSLDTETEQKIQEAMNRLVKNKTTLVIAHRLSTIENADKIIVLGNGKIIEAGSFMELMDKKGRFYRLHNAQFGSYMIFEQKLSQEVERARSLKRPLTMATLDIKQFEEEIEKQGIAQDKLLSTVEAIIEKHIRKIDFFVPSPRGKNVFFVVMPETNAKEAKDKVKDLIKHIKQKTFEDLHISSKVLVEYAVIKKEIKQLV